MTERKARIHAYFDEKAKAWKEASEQKADKRVNTVRQRNGIALRSLSEVSSVAGRVVDLGCGAGHLAVDCAEQGEQALGIDFSHAMISLAKTLAHEQGVTALCEFHESSLFDYDFGNEMFKMVSALGFIEYFEPSELQKVFSVFDALALPQGRIVVGSRNRLFNIFSLNDFSLCEIRSETLACLVEESMLLNQSAAQEDALDMLSKVEHNIPHLKQYPETQTAVAGYQYLPSQVVQIGLGFGWRARAIYGIRYHPVTPKLFGDHAHENTDFAQRLYEEQSHKAGYLPFCSSFVTVFEKKP